MVSFFNVLTEELYQMLDEVSAITGEHVDDRNLDHRVATGLQAHGGTGYIDEYLTRQGGVVDTHVELQALILRLTADTLADEVHAVTHITHIIDTGDLEHVRLVRGEVGVGLDGGSHLVEFGTILEFHIHHTAMDTLTPGPKLV